MSDRKRPWSKFYWSDWESDVSLGQCSLAAQGLWMRMLAICARSEPRGYLAIAGVDLTIGTLAHHCRTTETEVATLLEELERWGVFSRTRTSRIYSRRMVRDDKKSKDGRNAKINALSQDSQTIENKGENPGPSRSPPRGASTHIPDARDQIYINSPSLRSGECPPPLCDQAIEKPPDDQPPLALSTARPDELDQAFAAYNAAAERACLPKALKFDAARKAKLRQRLKECGGLSGWVAALEKLEASAMCCGDNGRGWRADLDFLLQPQSFIRLIEGRYDNRPTAGPSHAEQRYQPSSESSGKRDQRARKAAFFAGAARAFGG